jgi:uncharacterized protein YsxB (DUF464 family)
MIFACNGSSHTATSQVRFWKTCLWVSAGNWDTAISRLQSVCASASPIFAGTMNTIYLVGSILECVDRERVCEQTHVKVCNLEPSKGTVVLLLSILTSAAMLGYKAARTLCIGALL